MAEPNPNARFASEMQQKFEFYIVGLTFGILALSVQTASVKGPLVARAAELAGWVLLLISGAMGLWRLEWMPKIYQLEGAKQDKEALKGELRKQQLTGMRTVYVSQAEQVVPVETLIDLTNGNVAALSDRLKTLDQHTIYKYKVQRWTFILGLVALLVSRGYAPVMSIIADLRR